MGRHGRAMSVIILLLVLVHLCVSQDYVEELIENIPGVPGDDYPIYTSVPDSSFTCSGQVDGGYYSDPEADCQAFHICAGDGTGALTKYSFLCPNGTLFNQPYFVCDWWFNVDCSKVEEFYYLNEQSGPGDSDLGGQLAGYSPAAATRDSPSPLPLILEAAFKLGFANNRNQREINSKESIKFLENDF